MKVFWAIAYLILLTASPLQALRMHDGDLSLRPEEPKPPQLWNISLGGDARTALEELGKQGLVSTYSRAIPPNGRAHIHIFDGIPRQIAVAEGTTTALFFDNKLIRLDMRYTPSYAGFLTLRSQILERPDEKFFVTLGQAAMDNLLSTQLAHMSRHKYNREAEQLITESIKQGKTFYHYRFKEKSGRTDGALTYSMETDKEGKQTLLLQLYCNDQAGMQAYKEYREANR